MSTITSWCRRVLLRIFFAKLKKMKKCASQKLSRQSEKETRFEYNGYLSLKRDTEQHQRNEMRKMSRSSAAFRQWKQKSWTWESCQCAMVKITAMTRLLHDLLLCCRLWVTSSHKLIKCFAKRVQHGNIIKFVSSLMSCKWLYGTKWRKRKLWRSRAMQTVAVKCVLLCNILCRQFAVWTHRSWTYRVELDGCRRAAVVQQWLASRRWSCGQLVGGGRLERAQLEQRRRACGQRRGQLAQICSRQLGIHWYHRRCSRQFWLNRLARRVSIGPSRLRRHALHFAAWCHQYGNLERHNWTHIWDDPVGFNFF